jgi:hypothetical protein
MGSALADQLKKILFKLIAISVTIIKPICLRSFRVELISNSCQEVGGER